MAPAAAGHRQRPVAAGVGQAHMLGYQTRWSVDPARVKVCRKSRRIGISYATAAEQVIYASEDRGNIYYQCYDKDSTRQFISDCADWARTINAGIADTQEFILKDPDGSDREIQVYRIVLANGREIVGMTSSVRAFRSKGAPGDRAIIDEAAFVDNLAEALKAALAFVIWGGSVWIMSTPNGVDEPFNELCEDIKAGRLNYSLHEITLDDAIADGLVEKTQEALPPERRLSRAEWRQMIIDIYSKGRGEDHEDVQEELFCVPKQSGASFFSRQLLESRMVDAPVIRYQATGGFETAPREIRQAEMAAWLEQNVQPHLERLDPGERHCWGWDFGRHAHRSIIAPMAIGKTLRRRVPFILELGRVPHDQQRQVGVFIGRRLPRFCGGANDATGNGEAVAEDMGDEFGPRIIQQKFSEAWWSEWMPRYKAAYEDRQIEVPRDDDIMEDHRLVKLVNGIPKLPPAKAGADRHGDSVPALCLAWQASLSDHGPIEGQAGRPLAAAAAPDGSPGRPGQAGHWSDDLRGWL